jgi:hypothetical protein
MFSHVSPSTTRCYFGWGARRARAGAIDAVAQWFGGPFHSFPHSFPFLLLLLTQIILCYFILYFFMVFMLKLAILFADLLSLCERMATRRLCMLLSEVTRSPWKHCSREALTLGKWTR